jgi:DNA-binding beta-propeller fold protein YncE
MRNRKMTKIRAAVSSLLGSAALGLIAAGCGSDDLASPPAAAGSLVITPPRVVLGVGMSRQLSASVFDESGAPVPGETVSFESTDPSRVAVTGTGVASYVGAGDAEIHASSHDLRAAVPYTGLNSGHPKGTTISTVRLPGDEQGDAPFGVAVDGTGRILISQTNSGRLAWDLYPITSFTTQNIGGIPTSIALLSGGTALLTPTGADTNEATLVELSSGRVLAEVPLGVRAFAAVTAPDSQTVYLGTSDGRVLEFDVPTRSVTRSINLGVLKSRANHLVLNSAGTRLYASSFTSGSISEIDLTSKALVRIFVVGGEPQGMAVSLDGNQLYVADEAGTGEIAIYDLVAETLLSTIPSGATSTLGGAFGLAMSPDGTAVYVGIVDQNAPGLIQVINTGTHAIERTITSCGHTPRRIAFGYSGGLAVIPDESGCATFVE